MKYKILPKDSSRMDSQRVRVGERHRGYAIYTLDVSDHVVRWDAGTAVERQYALHEIVPLFPPFTDEDRGTALPQRALKSAELLDPISFAFIAPEIRRMGGWTIKLGEALRKSMSSLNVRHSDQNCKQYLTNKLPAKS